MSDCYGWADFWARALYPLGFETDEVVSNAEPMQKRWANENDLSFSPTDWLLEITEAQVKRFRPDVLFVNDYATFTAQFLQRLRSACTSIKLVIGWCGGPFTNEDPFREYDIVLSNIPELLEYFKRNGHNAFHVAHAFEPSILDRLPQTSNPQVDFSFVGSVVKRNQFHEKREQLLIELVEKTNLRIWCDSAQFSLVEKGKTLARQIAYDGVNAMQTIGMPSAVVPRIPLIGRISSWDQRPSLPESMDKRISERAFPPVYGLEMYQQLRSSKVTLNTHIDVSPRSASNMRLFEATGVGTCLLTDHKENIADLFEPDSEVVCFRSAEECVEKLRYLLEHEEARKSIAAAGQRRTLREHNFANRAAQLSEIISRALGGSSLTV